MPIRQLRREVDRIKSGNTKVGIAKDSDRLEGSTKQQIIDEAQGSVDLDGVDFVRYNNLMVLGDAVQGKQVFGSNNAYLGIDN